MSYDRPTSRDVQHIFQQYEELVKEYGLIRPGYNLALEIGSKTYGRAYRVYEQADRSLWGKTEDQWQEYGSDGRTVQPYYVAGYGVDDYVILHSFPTNYNSDGSRKLRPDNGREVDMSGWMLGPSRMYHLKVSKVAVDQVPMAGTEDGDWVHTTCDNCGLDIEGQLGEDNWRDRGNNTHCPDGSAHDHEE